MADDVLIARAASIERLDDFLDFTSTLLRA